MKQYERMINLLDVYKEEEKIIANPMKCIGHLNAAMCQLKLKEYTEAKNNCNKALELESKNIKGLFRRGQVCNKLQILFLSFEGTLFVSSKLRNLQRGYFYLSKTSFLKRNIFPGDASYPLYGGPVLRFATNQLLF